VNAYAEIAHRYREQFQAAPTWVLLAWLFLAIPYLCLPRVRTHLSEMRLLPRIALWVIVLGAAVAWSLSLVWLADDAYISFRYARNLVEGFGLVFNPGERVEGYTNFLWTILIAAGLWLGATVGPLAIVMGQICLVAFLVVIDRLARDPDKDAGPGLAVLLAAGSYSIAVFGTGGLETLFGVVLVLWAVQRTSVQAYFTGGTLAVAAAMARPDHGIFFATLGAALLLGRCGWKPLIRFAAPFGLFYAPYFLIRYSYYGRLLPNTFYAKAGQSAYYEQGLKYLYMNFVGSGLWALTPLVLMGLWQKPRTLWDRFALLSFPMFALYLARVGGDFMYARFVIVLIPFLLLWAEKGWRRLLANGHPRSAMALTAIAGIAIVPVRLIHPVEIFHFVADERTFYPVESLSRIRVEASHTHVGRALRRSLHKLGTKISIGNIGIIGYESRLPLYDEMGLTSPDVSAMPLTARGRPGHERAASPEQILAAGVELASSPVFPEPFTHFGKTTAGGWSFFLTRYDARIVAALGNSKWTTPVPSYEFELSKVYSGAGPSHWADVDCELWHEGIFFYKFNPNSTQRTPGLRWLSTLRPGSPDVLRFAWGDLDPASVGWMPESIANFSPGADGKVKGWNAAGSSTEGWPASGGQGQQNPVAGNVGHFLNTYSASVGDQAHGTFRSTPFSINGPLITLRVGGGKDPQNLVVSLEIDRTVVARATGCNTESLGYRQWDVSGHLGKQARVTVTDRSTGGWGHLMVDEITVWRVPPLAPQKQ
jgi:hypothetical protein